MFCNDLRKWLRVMRKIIDDKVDADLISIDFPLISISQSQFNLRLGTAEGISERTTKPTMHNAATRIVFFPIAITFQRIQLCFELSQLHFFVCSCCCAFYCAMDKYFHNCWWFTVAARCLLPRRERLQSSKSDQQSCCSCVCAHFSLDLFVATNLWHCVTKWGFSFIPSSTVFKAKQNLPLMTANCKRKARTWRRKQQIKKPHTNSRANTHEMRTNKKSTPYFESRLDLTTIKFPWKAVERFKSP